MSAAAVAIRADMDVKNIAFATGTNVIRKLDM
jgi:hypothetical protein